MIRRPAASGRLNIALGIVAASVISAVMAWQAAKAGELSGNTDEDARQNTVVAENLRLSDTLLLSGELRAYGRYEDAALSAQVKERAATALELEDPSRARRLREEAARDREQADAIRAELRLALPARDPATGEVSVDAAAARAILASVTEPRVRQLRPDQLRSEARESGLRSERLTGLAALAIGATFLLTLAEVAGGRPARLLAGSGASVLATVLVLFVVV